MNVTALVHLRLHQPVSDNDVDVQLRRVATQQQLKEPTTTQRNVSLPHLIEAKEHIQPWNQKTVFSDSQSLNGSITQPSEQPASTHLAHWYVCLPLSHHKLILSRNT